MKISVLVIFFLLAKSCLAQGYWVPFYTQANNSDTFLFDNQGIRIDNYGSGTRLVYVDVLVKKFEPYFFKNRTVNSMRTTYSYNCTNRRILVGDVTMHSGNDGDGIKINTVKSNRDWIEVKRDNPTHSLVERIKNYCN